jgi:hypothetical protein
MLIAVTMYHREIVGRIMDSLMSTERRLESSKLLLHRRFCVSFIIIITINLLQNYVTTNNVQAKCSTKLLCSVACNGRKKFVQRFLMSCGSRVGIRTGYGRSSSPGRAKNFHFSITFRPALWSTQPPIQWVRRFFLQS